MDGVIRKFTLKIHTEFFVLPMIYDIRDILNIFYDQISCNVYVHLFLFYISNMYNYTCGTSVYSNANINIKSFKHSMRTKSRQFA